MPNTPDEPRRLLLASNNAHKAAELSRLLGGCRILLPRELGITYDPEETADSFRENALDKAWALLALAGPGAADAVVADDSGLCVDALGGAPGVRSNRYGSVGGVLLSAEGKIELLLRELEGAASRVASFVCALAVVVERDRYWVVQETLRGVIRKEPAGRGGFGYDPVFEVPGMGRTLAELTAEEKDRVSHRGRAARLVKVLLESRAPD